MRMLAKAPEDRFQTADDLHSAIEAIAVRVGSALSPSGLARYLRELFGERPEPWVEMRSQESHGAGVTVTSEPIPPQLVASVGDALDAQLGAIPLLSDSGPGLPLLSPTQRMTAPMPHIA